MAVTEASKLQKFWRPVLDTSRRPKGACPCTNHVREMSGALLEVLSVVSPAPDFTRLNSAEVKNHLAAPRAAPGGHQTGAFSSQGQRQLLSVGVAAQAKLCKGRRSVPAQAQQTFASGHAHPCTYLHFVKLSKPARPKSKAGIGQHQVRTPRGTVS